MARAKFDIAGRLDLTFRNSRAGSKVFTFLNSAGDAYSLAGLTFKLRVRSYDNPTTNAFELASGNGLTISTNTITVVVSSTRANQPEKLHFWELYEETTEQTWLFGDVEFITKQPKTESDTTDVVVNTNPDEVTVTISSGAGVRFRGGFAATDDVYPDEDALQGDKFYSTQGATFNGQFYASKHFFEALETNPGNDHTKWRIY